MQVYLLCPYLLEFNEHGVPDGNILEEVPELVCEILVELNGHDELFESHQEIFHPIHTVKLPPIFSKLLVVILRYLGCPPKELCDG